MNDPLDLNPHTEPIVDREREKLVQQFIQFVEQFKDPSSGFVYKNKLQELSSQITLQVAISDLPPQLLDKLQAEPYRTKEIFQHAASKMTNDKPVQVQFIQAFQQQAMDIGELSSEHLEKLISVQGQLLCTSKIKPKLKKIVYICQTCRNMQETIVEDGVLMMPRAPICQTQNEGKKTCKPGSYIIAPQLCQYVDSQVIKLKSREDTSLTIRLEGSLVDRDMIAGDYFVFTGVYTQKALIAFGYRPANQELHIHAVNQQQMKQFANNKPLEQIKKLLAPHLHGLDTIKLAIACQQVRGTTKLTAEKTRLRGEINILLLSDPGTGKSELLRTAQQLSHISVQTSGRGTSAVGLTAAVIKDTSTGEFLLEGGALVMADGGLLCLDEFDKCRQDDVVALNEAMEQGTVSINKAGVQSVLSTRVSVLAAANPTFGRYDELRGLSEQADLQATIASRFDLIFFMRDIVDAERDTRVVHTFANNVQGQIQQQQDLAFLKEYFYECSQIQAQLSEEAGQYLNDFYVTLRKQTSNISVTVRQLEALIRISESIAKLHMRPTVTLKDAEVAVEIYKASTGDAAAVGLQETLGKVSSLQVAEAQKMLKERMPVNVPKNEVQLMNELRQVGLQEGAVMKAISLLIDNGEVSRQRAKYIMREK